MRSWAVGPRIPRGSVGLDVLGYHRRPDVRIDCMWLIIWQSAAGYPPSQPGARDPAFSQLCRMYRAQPTGRTRIGRSRRPRRGRL